MTLNEIHGYFGLCDLTSMNLLWISKFLTLSACQFTQLQQLQRCCWPISLFANEEVLFSFIFLCIAKIIQQQISQNKNSPFYFGITIWWNVNTNWSYKQCLGIGFVFVLFSRARRNKNWKAKWIYALFTIKIIISCEYK